MPRQNLGEFEQLVLLAILHLAPRDDVYGVPIVDEIERRTARNVSRVAVYVTLRRLEQKGSAVLDERPDRRARRQVAALRGGHARRDYALRESRHAIDQMWRGLDPKPGKVG